MERKEGRNFGDSDDEEFEQERSEMKILLEKFDHLDYVMENASLTAALLHYIFNKSQEYYSLLYCYTIRKYIRLNETKNSMRNYNHINMEIYTAFIHPNAILLIPFKNEELIDKIEENIDSEDCIIYFNKISEFIVRDVLSKYLEQFRENIRLGLESYSYTNKIHEDMNRMKELKMLEILHGSIHNSLIRTQKSRCLPSPKPDIKNIQIQFDFQIRAITLALNTQYEYFISSKKYSYVIKHPESRIPVKTFLSSPLVKLLGKQRIKGHSFEELSLSRVALCSVCDVILWGCYPCCLCCRNCKKAIHRECKDTVKYCQIEQKVNRNYESNHKNGDKEKRNADHITSDLFQIIDENRDSTDSKLSSEINNITTNPDEPKLEKDDIQLPKVNDGAKVSSKLSITRLHEWKLQMVTDKPRKNSVKYTKSMNSKNDLKKSNSDAVSHSGRLHRRSISEDSKLAASEEHFPTSVMERDEEMNVLETFEPEIELKLLTKTFNKSSLTEKAEYQRLLVLMEFHHKTKFTRMTLKRFRYLLVEPWLKLDEHLDLFDSLSLNCIDKLYKLIGSLVDVIDSCKDDASYDSSTAQRVLDWLTENNDYNLQQWLQLSTDLCCTNILHSVKALWIEHKQMSSKLNDLFSLEINRLLIIEQLSNMRSLLFNLPMIVTKIVKDLKRWPQFKDDAKMWEQVGHKLSYMPQLIDERCMPVVHLINNGIIMSSSLKYKRLKNGKEYSKEMETYINNFPKTVFKNDFVDFQFVKISNLRESRHVDLKSMQSVYVSEEIDAAVICYDKEIILLQKENDKYLLKQFKAPGAHKLFPMIQFDQVHVTKQTGKENKQFQHELTVILKHKAILAQILFKDESSRDMYFDHITKRSGQLNKEINTNFRPPSSSINSASTDNSNFEDDQNLGELEETNSLLTHTRMATIRTSFNESVNQFLNTFDLISNELSADDDQEVVLKRIKENGPSSPNEFMYGYMDVLKQYAILGAQMLDQSQSIDSSLMLQRDIIKMSTSNLKEITKQLNSLIQSQEQAGAESESSDESTAGIETRGVDLSEKSFRLTNYIEELIDESVIQLQNEQDPEQ